MKSLLLKNNEEIRSYLGKQNKNPTHLWMYPKSWTRRRGIFHAREPNYLMMMKILQSGDFSAL